VKNSRKKEKENGHVEHKINVNEVRSH